MDTWFGSVLKTCSYRLRLSFYNSFDDNSYINLILFGISVLSEACNTSSNSQLNIRNHAVWVTLDYLSPEPLLLRKIFGWNLSKDLQNKFNNIKVITSNDRPCGLVVRVPGYRSRRPGYDSRRYQFFWEVVGLERGPLSLVRIIGELLERKSSGSGLENRY
jgi:hypothetical protein